jgi:hypothetical protein
MWPRPFSLLVGALTAGPTAEGGRPSAGADLEPLFADGAARSFAPPPFWSSGCHPEALRWISSDITPVTKSTQLEIPGCSYPMAPTLADHGGLRPTVPRRLLGACQRRNLQFPSLPAAWSRARPNLAHRTLRRSAMSQGHSPRTRRSALAINICCSKCRPRRTALTGGKTNSRRSADGDFM